MSRDLTQLKSLISQGAAKLMIEDGINDFGQAKKKAARQLGISDNALLPSNIEIEQEIKLLQEIYYADEQPEICHALRVAALATMQIFEKFQPHLTGTVLDGSASKFSNTEIHLFADSEKEVEIFLLNQQIPFTSSEKFYRFSDKPSKTKNNLSHKKVPIFTLETELGLQKLSVFDTDDLRKLVKKTTESSLDRIDLPNLKVMLALTSS